MTEGVWTMVTRAELLIHQDCGWPGGSVRGLTVQQDEGRKENLGTPVLLAVLPCTGQCPSSCCTVKPQTYSTRAGIQDSVATWQVGKTRKGDRVV